MAKFFVTAAVAQGFINGGSGLNTALGTGSLIKLYAGTWNTASQDADSTVSSPTLLATLTIVGAALGTAATTGSAPTRTASSALGTVSSASAVATGTAAYFDWTTSAGTVVARGDISTVTAGTGSMQLNTTAVTTGSTVAITSGTVSTLLGG